jgi:hypothetical protein
LPLPDDPTPKDLLQTFLYDYEVPMGPTEFCLLAPLNVDPSTITVAINAPKVCGSNCDS